MHRFENDCTDYPFNWCNQNNTWYNHSLKNEGLAKQDVCQRLLEKVIVVYAFPFSVSGYVDLKKFFKFFLLPRQLAGAAGPGFDLSLSFSLIAQSKAPLENYRTRVIMIFHLLFIFNGVQEGFAVSEFGPPIGGFGFVS